MERESTPSVRDTYWQQQEEGRFALHSEGEERALIDLEHQGVTLHHEVGFTADLVVPDYVCAFDAAERHLGFPRIEDVRGADGSPDPDARRSAEREAELNAETRTPEQWARAYAARALHLLTLNGVDRELSGDENQAGVRLADAVAIIDRHDLDTFWGARDHLEVASALLANGRADERYGSASLACDKALAVFEYEDVEQIMREAAAEEALRRDGVRPFERDATTERGDDGANDWRFQPSRGGRASERAHQRDIDDSGRER